MTTDLGAKNFIKPKPVVSDKDVEAFLKSQTQGAGSLVKETSSSSTSKSTYGTIGNPNKKQNTGIKTISYVINIYMNGKQVEKFPIAGQHTCQTCLHLSDKEISENK